MPNLLSEDRICVKPVKRTADTSAVRPAHATAAVAAAVSAAFSTHSKTSFRRIAAAIQPVPLATPAATAVFAAAPGTEMTEAAGHADSVPAARSTRARMPTTPANTHSDIKQAVPPRSADARTIPAAGAAVIAAVAGNATMTEIV